MLYARPRARSWGYALGGAAIAAIGLALWVGLEVGRLRAGHGWPAAAPGGLAGASFAFICEAVGPSLPYLSAALLPAALAVMAPCLLQMSIVLVTAVAGAAAGAAQLRRPGLAFAAGFLGA